MKKDIRINENDIAKLEAKGFKRWTKAGHDRLYINAKELGLECDYYKSGNICHSEFKGEEISHRRAYNMKGSKTYIDLIRAKIFK